MSVKKSLVIVALLILVASVSFSFQMTQEKRVVIKKDGDRGAWLGVQLKATKASVSSDKKSETTTGEVTVVRVEKDSPAEKAGIQKDDILLEFNGKKLDDPETLIKNLSETKKGDKVTMLLLRDKEKKTVTVELGERPERKDRFGTGKNRRAGSFNMPRVRNFNFDSESNSLFFGATLMKLNTELGDYFKSPTKKGMLITKIKKESSSEKAGLKVGDVIVGIGKESIEDRHDISSAISDYKKGDKIEVKIIRKEKAMTISITISEEDIKKRNNRRMFFFDGDNDMSFDFDQDTLKFKNFRFKFDTDSISFDSDELREHFKNLPRELGKLRNFGYYHGDHFKNLGGMFREFSKKYKISIDIDDESDEGSIKKDTIRIKKQSGEGQENRKNIRVKVRKLSDDDEESVIIISK